VFGFALAYVNVVSVAEVFIIDPETVVGAFSAGLNGLNMVILGIFWWRFVDSPPDSEYFLKPADFEREPINLFPVWISVFLFFVMGTTFSTFEAMVPMVTDYEYYWSVKGNGLLFLCVGIGTVITNFMASFWFSKFDDRKLALFGYFMCVLSFSMMIRWPFQVLGEELHLPLEQFVLGAAFVTLAYPFTFAFISIYLKCMHPMYHEEKAKWLLFGGTLSRVVGPIWAGYAFYYGYLLHGFGFVMLGNVGLTTFAFVLLLGFYSKLKPHIIYTPRTAF